MNDKKYYVYLYLRGKDSSGGAKGTPYYVGKGYSTRAYRVDRKFPCPQDLACLEFAAKNMFEWDAYQLEISLIYLYGRIDKGTGCLRNGTDGGEGASGQIKSPEERKAIGDRFRGKKLSQERIERMREISRGKKQSPEQIAKRAASNRGRKRSEEFKAKRRAYKVPEERKARIVAGLTGQKRSPEAIENIKKGRSAVVITPEWRKKMSEAQYRRHGRVPIEKDFHGTLSRYQKRAIKLSPKDSTLFVDSLSVHPEVAQL